MIQRVRQYIIDSYNGLYKIVLEPSMPTKQTVILLVFGVIVGLVWGYAIAPTIYYNGDPSQLSQNGRDQWVKLVAASYQANLYDDQTTLSLLGQVENPAEAVNRLAAAAPENSVEQASLQKVQGLLASNQVAGRPAPRPSGFVSQLIGLLIPLIILVVLTPIVVVVWRLLLYPNIVAPLADRVRPKSAEELQKRAELAAEKQARLKEIELQKSVVKQVDEQLGDPVIQKLSIYTKGRQYDDSFAIEDKNEMFLGECGASKAKTIGSGELAAIEIWLFDKEDFVRTLAKEFVSEQAYNDPAIRSELDNKVDNPATDIIPVSEGAKLILETDQLRLQATVKSFTYGTAADLPPNSYFEAINIEVAVWQKAAAGVPRATPVAMPATPVAPSYGAAPVPPAVLPPAPTFNPPPMAPSSRPVAPTQPSAVPPASGAPAIRPLSPPLQPQRPPAPPPEDEDPFGGTGDFTPIGN